MRSTPVVADVVSAAPVCVQPETRLKEVLLLLERYEIRHLPVISDGVLVGFVSERDLREVSGPLLAPEEAREKLDWPVFRIMADEVLTLESQQPLLEVVDLFLAHKIGAAPVVDAEGHVLGVVSTLDLLRELRRRLQ